MQAIPAIVLCILISSVTHAEKVDYAREVKPLLAAKCTACHGALKSEAGLRLDAAALIVRGGATGVVIAPGDAKNSLLIQKVSESDASLRMPPEGEGEPLSDAQIEILRMWIDQGAVAPDEPIPPEPREHWAYQPVAFSTAPKLVATARSGKADAQGGSQTSIIDAFLARAQREAGTAPLGPADKAVLLRRVYIDLIGLPPSREELRAFIDDGRPQAYEEVVDRLLSRPQYGERWGRHWMDVWRYSDWTGYGNEIRYSQRHIWRWRDWIVESLNADKGYDQMVQEMLAADELAPGDDNAVRATGFLARNWYKFDRDSWLDDVVDHTSKAFLGITAKCARCHDHKYDPISQREYYALRAIFEPYDVRIDGVPGQSDAEKDGTPRVYDAHADKATYLLLRGDPKRPKTDEAIGPSVPSILRGPSFEVSSISLPVESYYPALRDFAIGDMVVDAERKVTTAEAEVEQISQRVAESTRPLEPASIANVPPQETQAEVRELNSVEDLTLAHAKQKVEVARSRLAALKARISAEQAKYPTSSDRSKSPAADPLVLAKSAARAERLAAFSEAVEKLLAAQIDCARVNEEGQAAGSKQMAVDAAKEKVAAAQKVVEQARHELSQESEAYQPLGPIFPKTSTGRRLALARWITDKRNPLTPRVAVNHVWLRHFGQPLVDDVADFGLRTARPRHAELLDSLALEFLKSGWSMKRLHRQIVLSAAYQRASHPSVNPGEDEAQAFQANLASDPENRNYWRMDVRRLEAEAVRDAILYVSGRLDLTLGGPDGDAAQGLVLPRRSLYFRHARERQMEFLTLFDAANPEECYRRRDSIRPQQTFAMFNSSLAIHQARRLAEQIAQDCASKPGSLDDYFVTAAFEIILSRAPNASEQAACLRFLTTLSDQLAKPASLDLLYEGDDPVPPARDPHQRARENLVLALFNHNDFITIR